MLGRRCAAPRRRRPDGRHVFLAAFGGSGPEGPRTDNRTRTVSYLRRVAGSGNGPGGGAFEAGPCSRRQR